jgi:hypothetical protein
MIGQRAAVLMKPLAFALKRQIVATGAGALIVKDLAANVGAALLMGCKLLRRHILGPLDPKPHGRVLSCD